MYVFNSALDLKNDNVYGAFGELSVFEATPKISVGFHYGINRELITSGTTLSGFVTASNSLVIVQTSGVSNSSASVVTNDVLKYNPGQGGLAEFTAIFSTPKLGSTQLIGLGNSADGYFFGYSGTSFGVMRRQNSIDYWTPQTEWNGNRFNVNTIIKEVLDFTKGNVFKIDYQWLGFGGIRYYIENPVTAKFELVHLNQYAGKHTIPSVLNPTLPITLEAKNYENNSNIVLQSASLFAGIEGRELHTSSIRQSKSATKTISTESCVLIIRNNTTFNGFSNKVRLKPDVLSVSAEGTKSVIFRIVLNPAFSGGVTYNNIEPNTSVVSYSTSDVTISGGKELFVVNLAKSDSKIINPFLEQLNFHPGDVLVIVASSASSSDVGVSLGWLELF